MNDRVELIRKKLLLALAELALSRPGFDEALRLIAHQLNRLDIFESTKISNADRVKASHGPFGFAPIGAPKEKVMKPSIGRIVIYKYGDGEKCQHTNGAMECPAVIVRVWSDTCVNLKLIEDGPQNSWKTSVLQGELNGPAGQWCWPERVG